MQTPVATATIGANRRVFVIEPDEVIRSALFFIMREEYETQAFLTLDQAMSGAADARPDVIVMGMNVVRFGGDGLWSALKTALPDTGVLLLTDGADDPLARRCLERGAHGLIGKPITSSSVLDKVEALFGHDKLTAIRPGPQAAAGASGI